ncbi:M1 family metallopeptidase [Persicobacter diffluens]|uniref:Peptidase M1 n=1 Tax=Persicobacter diffluens TaxID=981 RepID=A0AAN4W1K8_9BACT|nr:peptidase M1 [Persicobacter diffluens]
MTNYFKAFLYLFFLLYATTLLAHGFQEADTLLGKNGPYRAWWDAQHYALKLTVDVEGKGIYGTNDITFMAIDAGHKMQIDLQEPMKAEAFIFNGEELPFERIAPAYFVTLPTTLSAGESYTLQVKFRGKPKIAKKAPWDGGFVWSEDKSGNLFMATACQGEGASSWWPCKDYPADEVKGMDIYVSVPKGYMDVSNGRLISRKKDQGVWTYHWQVKNPINNYGVNLNVAKYVHFAEQYQGEKGELDLNYYVLPENLEKAKKQFQEVPRMLAAFEHWFGPYPFYEDGFKLVEVPYLGMEHQSSVTYGNQYANGYLGRDLSGSGWGLKFDFIIVHEAGHEWFANNITNSDIADMWIHEGFTTYSEALFVDYYWGKEACNEYMRGIRKRVLNDQNVIGEYGMNQMGSGDMYVKGALLVHNLRLWVNDDTVFRNMLREMNNKYYHQTISSAQLEAFISNYLNLNLSGFFDQYLRSTMIPTLEYEVRGKVLFYRWINVVEHFQMPVELHINGEQKRLFPAANWQKLPLNNPSVPIAHDSDFYCGFQFNGQFPH